MDMFERWACFVLSVLFAPLTPRLLLAQCRSDALHRGDGERVILRVASVTEPAQEARVLPLALAVQASREPQSVDDMKELADEVLVLESKVLEVELDDNLCVLSAQGQISLEGRQRYLLHLRLWGAGRDVVMYAV